MTRINDNKSEAEFDQNLAEIVSTPKYMATFVLLIPIYIIVFAVFYNPTFGLGADALRVWDEASSMTIPLLASISLLVLLLSRGGLFVMSRRARLTDLHYLVWQVAEWALISLFASLYISLYFHIPYFRAVPTASLYSIMVLVFPYVLLWMSAKHCQQRHALTRLTEQLEELQRGMPRSDERIVSFVDERGNEKIAIGSDSIIYIESAGNYVDIVYESGDKVDRYCLRNTLKSIEATCTQNGLVRCHRSYLVNLRKVKMLRHESDGVYAVLHVHSLADIPVSKTYAAEVARLYSQIEM
ncbi:MAG: LytTR family transcriptional regulator [Bacteroidales bacterium]|nr:LytTR family transcriptional regulator [Bacteroidales bacterium]